MSTDSSLDFIKKTRESPWLRAHKRYEDLSRRKRKNREYGHKIYNLPEDEIQRLLEYRKKYYKIWKNKEM